MKKYFFLFTLMIFLISCWNEIRWTWVYSWIWIIWNDRYDLSLYLREDWTFTESLWKSDWKNRVDWNYKIEGEKLIINKKNWNKEEYFYKDNYNYIDAWWYNLFKVDIVNEIPAWWYSFKNISILDSSWNFSSSWKTWYLYFDWKWNFSNNKSSFSSTSYINSSWWTYIWEDYKWTYKIKDWELTLIFDNWKEEKHSFFYWKPSKLGLDATIVVDWNIYYQKQ